MRVTLMLEWGQWRRQHQNFRGEKGGQEIFLGGQKCDKCARSAQKFAIFIPKLSNLG